MKKNASRLLLGLLMASLLMPARAQTPPTATGSPAAPGAGSSEEVQPKFFVWGLLLNVAFKFAMGVFSEWRQNKLTNDLTNPINYKKLLLNAATAGLVSTAGGGVGGLFGFKSVGATENTVADLPTRPIELQNGQPNYQGAHVAIVAFDKAGTVTGLRPVTGGFRTGDRIKIKVLPTFDSLVVIENINPQGKRQQIYPSADQAIALKAGTEVLLPLRADQFFEFAGVTGDEQLVITLRDPRAAGAAESKAEVSRKDEDNGSSFVQELAPGTYPVIAQSLKLRHER
ncbi:MAG: DUF4384 domain-containing protein [Hylemonella sp.]|nr:DUF4384 domain-containing protein [Hylemonella sp.]